MFSLGGAEVIVILLVTLLAFGPDKLPEAARRAGQVRTDIRRWSTTARRELAKAMEVPPDGNPPPSANP